MRHSDRTGTTIPRTNAYSVSPRGIIAGLALLFCGWLISTFGIIIMTVSLSAERDDSAGSLEALTSRKRTKTSSLSCVKFGGPRDAHEEMVYWSDSPADDDPSYFRNQFDSYDPHGGDKFMTAEFGGGFNNIRMSLETSVLLARGLGRTLVLPPNQNVYLMDDKYGGQETHFSLNDFFHLLDRSMRIIPMSAFLESVAMKGMLVNKWTHKVELPPHNRTGWDNHHDVSDLWKYLRRCGISRPEWKPSESVFVVPSNNATGDEARTDLSVALSLRSATQGKAFENGRGFPTDAAPEIRIRELLARQVQRIVSSDAQMDSAVLVHFTDAFANFYSYVFFQDWRRDLWAKRWVRDKLRYRDELQCAAARVVAAVRKLARQRDPERNPDGLFDSFHIRRGDFAVRSTRVSARTLYENSRDKLTKGRLVYVATDERDATFLGELKALFDHRLVFLEDVKDHIGSAINTNMNNVIEQLVCSRGLVFWGTWASTFSSLIIRLRGYRAEMGIERNHTLHSYYFAPTQKINEMQAYSPITTYWMREFPAAWQDIGVSDSTEMLPSPA